MNGTEMHNLVAGIERLDAARVVCVGDLMLDHYIYGDVTRVSPEGPVPVLRIQDHRSMLGGAGNAVRNLASLGVPVTIISVLGDDPAADTVLGLLQSIPGCTIRVARDRGRITSVKTRFIAKNQQLLRTDVETAEPLAANSLNGLLADFESALAQANVVLLSDYAKGVLSGNHAAEFIRLANTHGVPVIVDPKGRDFRRYAGANAIKPNLKELAEATGLPVETDAQAEAAGRQLIASTGVHAVLVTRGAQGMMLIEDGGPALCFSALAREVYDVSGAGDTVAALLAAGMGAELPAVDAVRIANVAAGLVVGRSGTAVVERREIIQELERQTVLEASAKVLPRREAAEMVARWQRDGLRVGFTNGCFEYLHPGHIRLIEQARSRCDRLVVGLNSDASAGRFRESSGPIPDEASRAIVLASLRCVDLVVIFEEDTPEHLIRSLKPQLLVEGDDKTESAT